MKKGLSLLLCLALLCSMFALPTAAYTATVSRTDKTAMAAALKELGLFRGVSDTDFALEKSMTRVEAMVMLLRVMGCEADALAVRADNPFTDTPAWAESYLGYAYKHKLTYGISDTQFGTDNINAASFLTLILRALGYSDADEADFAWNDPFPLARRVGILDGTVNTVDFKRGDAVIVCYYALFARIKGTSLTLADKLIAAGLFKDSAFDAAIKKASEASGSASGLVGLSAYDIAVKNGFNGTEKEWLASLVGARGSRGASGADGKDGKDGVDGLTPFVGTNGNWWIGTTDTGIFALGLKGDKGEKGDKGDKGDTGAQGIQGEKGEKGDTGADGLTPYIGTNMNWWIGTTDTGISALGLKGDKGEKGDTGAQGIQGEKGEKGDTGAQGIQGEKGDKGDKGDTGADGLTPYIGTNMNWWIGTTDTGISALGIKGEKGEKGDTGAQGIQGEKGEKGDTGAQGIQGEKGDKGDKGDTGADGLTPYIGTNMNWWIGTTDTGISALGIKGEKGDKGDTGAQGIQGEKGEKGDTGAQGIQGEKGDKGDKGDTGADGRDGTDGRGIESAEIVNGELILHYTDGTSDKLAVTNRDNNYFSYYKTTVNGVTGYAIALTDQYLHSVEAIEIPESYNGLPVIQLGYYYEKVGQYSSSYNGCNVPCGFQSVSLKSIVIPESIMRIYSQTFYVQRGTSALESAVFAHPTGWVKTGYGSDKAVQEGVLSDPAAAANALAKTDCIYRFERTDY